MTPEYSIQTFVHPNTDSYFACSFNRDLKVVETINQYQFIKDIIKCTNLYKANKKFCSDFCSVKMYNRFIEDISAFLTNCTARYIQFAFYFIFQFMAGALL